MSNKYYDFSYRCLRYIHNMHALVYTHVCIGIPVVTWSHKPFSVIPSSFRVGHFGTSLHTRLLLLFSILTPPFAEAISLKIPRSGSPWPPVKCLREKHDLRRGKRFRVKTFCGYTVSMFMPLHAYAHLSLT